MGVVGVLDQITLRMISLLAQETGAREAAMRNIVDGYWARVTVPSSNATDGNANQHGLRGY